jgi:hypothetical protein
MNGRYGRLVEPKRVSAADTGRHEYVVAWRDALSDPERVDRFRRHALDIITDGTMLSVDDLVEQLDDDDRAAYIEHVADLLGAALLSWVAGWTMSDMPLVEAWFRQRCDGSAG